MWRGLPRRSGIVPPRCGSSPDILLTENLLLVNPSHEEPRHRAATLLVAEPPLAVLHKITLSRGDSLLVNPSHEEPRPPPAARAACPA